MNISKISKWTRNKNTKILYTLFLIIWCISTWFWISANSNLNIFSIWYSLLLLLSWIITPYMSKNLYLGLRKKVMDDPHTYKLDENIKLSTDPRNFDLSYSIVTGMLTLIIKFLKFNTLSLNLLFFISINLTFGMMFVFIIAFSGKLKVTLTCIFIMCGINILYIIIGYTLPIAINYELTPFDPFFVFLVLLISIVVERRVSKVYLSSSISKTS